MQQTVLPRILRHRGARDTTRAQIVRLLSQQVATTDRVAVNTTYSNADDDGGARRKRRRGSSAVTATPETVRRPQVRVTPGSTRRAHAGFAGGTTPVFSLNEEF